MFVLYKRYCLFDCFRPGFGVTLNREGLERPYTRTAEQVYLMLPGVFLVITTIHVSFEGEKEF